MLLYINEDQLIGLAIQCNITHIAAVNILKFNITFQQRKEINDFAECITDAIDL